MKMVVRKAYTAFGETGFGDMGFGKTDSAKREDTFSACAAVQTSHLKRLTVSEWCRRSLRVMKLSVFNRPYITAPGTFSEILPLLRCT